MRGCICKNEQEEILVVGRKTSDRVGIRAEVLDLRTQMHSIRTVNEEDVFLFAA